MTDNENLQTLPAGWCWTTIGEISEVKGGKRLPKGHDYSETSTGFPYIRVTDFENMSINLKSLKFLNPSTQKHISNYTISKNDIYISIAGSIGKVGLIPEKLDGSNLTENAAKITEIKYGDKKFLCYVLTSIASQEQIKKFTISSNQPKLALFRIKQIIIPLPPLPEQHRIVQKIEELFTDLDAGVQALKKAKIQIKNYRQAVSKAAFEGKLVPTEAEPREKDRNFSPALDIKKLDKLPIGWNAVDLQDVCSLIIDCPHSTPKYTDEGILVIRTSNVKNGNLVLDLPSFTSDQEYIERIKRGEPKYGDILFTREAPVGEACLVPTVLKLCLGQRMMLIRTNDSLLNNSFLVYAFYSKNVRESMLLQSRGITAKHLNVSDVKKIIIPLPPLAEQHRIVCEIERLFSVIEQIEKTIDQSLIQAEKLRQSILKKAFEGKLVPHDPNDEPAIFILKKIMEENAKLRNSIETKIKHTSKLRTKNMKKMKDSTTDTQDVELYEMLNLSNKPLSPKKLWELSKLDIEDFYEKLKIEVEKGRIIEHRPNDKEVYLEINE